MKLNKPTKKKPWWVRMFVGITLLLLIVGTSKYIWFPALVFLKHQTFIVGIAIAFLIISSWVEHKLSSDPDSNYTLIFGGVIVVFFIIWGINWGISWGISDCCK
jgi:hypothetical protein